MQMNKIKKITESDENLSPIAKKKTTNKCTV